MTTLFLPANTQLSVVADGSSTGSVVKIVNGLRTDTTSIAVSTTTTFGPFNDPFSYDVISLAGTLTTSQAPLAVIEGVTSTAAELNILDGVTATAVELNLIDGYTGTTVELNLIDGYTGTTADLNILATAPSDVTIAYTTGSATDNIITTFTVKDSTGTVITDAFLLDVWISDSANGEVLTSTGASGALTLTTGVQLSEETAKKHIRILTDENGVLVTDLVDSANTAGEYFCCRHPLTGATIIGPATAATDYEGGV